MWCANTSASASNTIICEWFTNNPYLGSSSKIYSDTAIGTTNVAHVHCKPPKESYSSAWLPNISADPYTVFNLTCPQGTIIDVNMTVELVDDEAPIAITGTISGASSGTLYTRPLDSIGVTPSLIPIGVNTI